MKRRLSAYINSVGVFVYIECAMVALYLLATFAALSQPPMSHHSVGVGQWHTISENQFENYRVRQHKTIERKH